MDLLQIQADEYMQVRKRFLKTTNLNLNQPFKVIEPLVSDTHGDIFKLDLRQGKIELKLVNLNSRAKDIFVICRLDIDDKTHKNPDNSKLKCMHIHLYKEGFGDKFAYPALSYGFKDSDSLLAIINKFLDFCNIDRSKIILQGRLNW